METLVIETIFTRLGSPTTDRFRAAKELQQLSRENPVSLYPYFDQVAGLLENNSSVLLWNGIISISFLATVDYEKKFDAIFDRYYRHLWDGKLVTAANILANSGRIARSHPDLAPRITCELLKVDLIPLPTAECREVARGHSLSAFSEYFYLVQDNEAVIKFVVACCSSHRKSVKKKAESLVTLFTG